MIKAATEVPILKRTPLFDLHKESNARMMGFGGWEMPVQYAGITVEHQAVRQRAGMFDISHMGKFAVRSNNLIEQLQSLVPSDLSRLQPGAARYTVLLNEQAGILDDIIFYYQGQDAESQERGLMIVNASTTAKDKAWLLGHLDTTQVELQDLSTAKALIAFQGPQVVAQLQTLTPDDLAQIKPFGHRAGTILDQPAWFARTGYTGEDGFEVMVEPEVGRQLWRSLLELGVTPCGLGARDTLRLEAAMALYGQDIDETTTPLEAGLGWVVHLDKGNFVGRAVLEHQLQMGVTRKLVGLQMQGRNIARHGYPVLFAGQPVGVVTSGTLAPTIGRAISLAYVPVQFAQPGQALEVEIRGKPYPALVVQRPFYRRPSKLVS
ncbi:Aminomethyltransferase (glycine cleavage system T protein) [uncultured Synechococcales cyanobacterium]|uniref:Aminomethyltransferase n=1 Tax=uncultured Synechococcales cyanobacterium TaxID=1936017 RepID=A0A6J4VT85_9CYAN|nr:Aminomethyltransferase (glycine cleavage system T protein) [uncultured Synechococcales cyanobacterium]